MHRALLWISSLLVVTPIGSALAAEPVLAVLYVANHSGDARYDVLHKGLADMLVTDLQAQGLTVVERARLQALIDEQALQATSFVDPKTAVRIGQGLGATHVVTGSLAAVSPRMRMDMRMVDVATGEVVVTASAQGTSQAFFELEQELVARFVSAFDRRFVALPVTQTRVQDAEAALAFSRGLDLADKGDVTRAREELDRVVSRSPAFGLARARRDAFAQRLADAKERRAELATADRAALQEAAARAAATRATTPEQVARRLAWLGVRWRLAAQAVPPLLSARPLGVAALGREAELLRAERALAEAIADYVKQLDELAAREPGAMIRRELPPEDERRSSALELALSSLPNEPGAARLELVRFVLLGRVSDVPGGTHVVAPPLGLVDAAWERRARAALDEAIALAHARAGARAGGEHQAIVALELASEVELAAGRVEEAVAALQSALDRYPTSSAFTRVERQVKLALGLEEDHATRDRLSWARGLASCLDMPLRVALDHVLDARLRRRGLPALPEVAAEVEAACADQPGVRRFWDYLDVHVALVFGKHGRCAEFEAWMAKAIAAGASPGDVEGWRRNWTACPLPPGAPPR